MEDLTMEDFRTEIGGREGDEETAHYVIAQARLSVLGAFVLAIQALPFPTISSSRHRQLRAYTFNTYRHHNCILMQIQSTELQGSRM